MLPFHPQVQKILLALFEQGFYVTLVGGATREYFLNNEDTKIWDKFFDLDFEIRHQQKFEGKSWEKKLEELSSNLDQSPEVEVRNLPYGVIRLKLQDFDVELASPREETFISGMTGHSNFKAKLSSVLSYDQAFSRRDFTINAIGIEFKSLDQFQVVDPLRGREALTEKKLVPCSTSFHLDPVRFLRAIRFLLLLQEKGFIFSEKVKEYFSQFNLSAMTAHYIFYEAFSSKRPLSFFLKAMAIMEEYSLTNEIFSDLDFLKKLQGKFTDQDERLIGNEEDLGLYFTFRTDILTWKELQLLAKNSKVGIQFLKSWHAFFFELQKLEKFSPPTVKSKLMELKEESCEQDPFFNLLLELYSFFRKLPPLTHSQEKLIIRHRADYMLFKKLKLDQSLLGKENFEEWMNKHPQDVSQRKKYQLYFHLKALSASAP